MEDYKKKYEESLERGLRLWESGSITLEEYEYMFPEHKESKDERIRKFLYDFINNIPPEEWNVAKWTREHSAELLEFAREQNPAWSEEDEKLYLQCIDVMEHFPSPNHKVAWNACTKWLKSLKERMKGE